MNQLSNVLHSTWLTICYCTVLFVLLLFVLRRAKATRNEATGELTFRYHPIMHGLAYLGVLWVPVLAYILIYVKPPKKGADPDWVIVTAVVMAGLFQAVGIGFLWEVNHYTLRASAAGLDCRSAWRRARFLKWSEVEKLSYSHGNKWFVVHATDGWLFRVPIGVSGIVQFLELCASHLSLLQLEEAKPGLDTFGLEFYTPDESSRAS